MDLSPLNKVIPSWGSPTLEGFDTTNIQDGQRLKGSARQYVRFYKKKFMEVVATKVQTNEKTGSVKVLETAVQEIEREMVHIVTPGDKNEIDTIAQDFHKREHWAAYKAFRDGRSAPLGQPIEECTFVSPSIALELKYLGVHTLEQLADSSDLLCGRVANGFELREYAKAMAKANVDNKSLDQVNSLRVELEKAQATIEKMANAQKAMQSTLLDMRGEPVLSENSEVEETVKRSPGRPRKIINEAIE